MRSLDPDDVDRRPIKFRQDWRRYHLLDRAERRMSAAEIKHLVDGVEQRVQFMRAEEHGDPELGLQAFDQLDDLLLTARIEADQRFVEEQQFRVADQRLRQQQPLALAAGEFA